MEAECRPRKMRFSLFQASIVHYKIASIDRMSLYGSEMASDMCSRPWS